MTTHRFILDFNKARSTPEVQANFHQYLVQSYNREPLEFLISVDEYNQEKDLKTRIERAKQIAETYIKDGCRLEINIDGGSRKNLLGKINSLNTESENLELLFEETYRIVGSELKNDSFARYLDSAMFYEFSQKKGAKYMTGLCSKDSKPAVQFSRFDENGCIRDQDITALLSMVSLLCIVTNNKG
jgi:hypothetical protein